jgi:phosphoenolpyruvate synthase/pyruvate phosphate dikinase
VRSGARESMPGMLDTVLNLGLSDESVLGLAKQTENDRFAWDSYRRFVQMFGNVSRGIPGERFEEAIRAAKSERGVKEDTDLDVDALRELSTIDPSSLDALLHPTFDPKADFEVLATGVDASPGAATGTSSLPPLTPWPPPRRDVT